MPDQFIDICYEKNFLKEVVARIDFVSPINEIISELPEEIGRVAGKHFPVPDPKKGFTKEIQFKIGESDLSQQESNFTEWNFYGKNREKRLVITPMHIFVSHFKYENYEIFIDEFMDVILAFMGKFSKTQSSRIGLRYINQFTIDGSEPLDWDDYINDKLLGSFKFSPNNSELSRIIHKLVYSFSDFYLSFQYGNHNPDFPSPIIQKLFMLDLDAYFQGIIESGEVKGYFDKLHEKIQEYFELSITEKLREVMNAR